MRLPTISLCACFMLGGCASALKFENVTGSWSCPRIDGKCETISRIDAGLQDRENGFAIAPPAGDNPLPSEAALPDRQPAPVRTGDEVARIVLAPMITASGDYVGARDVYAVMRGGVWRAPALATREPGAPRVAPGAGSAAPAPENAKDKEGDHER